MAHFSDLPTEIQLLITRDLPRSELFELKSLNSLFLNQWMDIRWELVVVELRSPDSAVRLLQRVVDPFVATRPKELTVNVDQRKLPELTISTLPKPESQTFNGAMTVLLDSLPLLLNITCLTIEVFEKLTFDLVTFFQRIVSSSFARKLQSLSLSGLVGILTSLWECSAHSTPFESLTRLNLYLLDDPITQTEFSPSLEHFLRSLSPTLEWLYISTTIERSPLFNALTQPLSLSQSHSPIPFPNLTSLFLRLQFNTSMRSDPLTFRRFLLIHKNLRYLHLRAHGVPGSETEEPLGALLTELVNNNDQLSSLQILDIYPTVTQAGLSALLTLIKRSTPTLTSLVIPTRYLTDEEVNQVVNALTEDGVRGMTTTTTREEPRKLKSLKMNISCLSVPFLDLLARKLPQLEALGLWVNDIFDSDQDSFYDQLSRRQYDPNITCSQDTLHTWNLQHLSIYWNWEKARESKRAELAVMGAVPALARSLGWGDMDMEDGDGSNT